MQRCLWIDGCRLDSKLWDICTFVELSINVPEGLSKMALGEIRVESL